MTYDRSPILITSFLFDAHKETETKAG